MSANSRPSLELLRSAGAREQTAKVDGSRTLACRSGRALTVHEAGPGIDDCLEVRSPEGKVELSVRFTAQGPVLSFEGAHLDLKSAARVSLDCEELVLNGRKGVSLRSGGEMVVRSQDDMHIDGGNVLINCDPALHPPAQAPEPPLPAHEHTAGCCQPRVIR